jgi:hypothetical protein
MIRAVAEAEAAVVAVVDMLAVVVVLVVVVVITAVIVEAEAVTVVTVANVVESVVVIAQPVAAADVFPVIAVGAARGVASTRNDLDVLRVASKVEVKVQPVMQMDFVKAVAVERVAQQLAARDLLVEQ